MAEKLDMTLDLLDCIEPDLEADPTPPTPEERAREAGHKKALRRGRRGEEMEKTEPSGAFYIDILALAPGVRRSRGTYVQQ